MLVWREVGLGASDNMGNYRLCRGFETFLLEIWKCLCLWSPFIFNELFAFLFVCFASVSTIYLWLFWSLLYMPDWLYVFKDPPDSASRVLGVKVFVTTPGKLL